MYKRAEYQLITERMKEPRRFIQVRYGCPADRKINGGQTGTESFGGYAEALFCTVSVVPS